MSSASPAGPTRLQELLADIVERTHGRPTGKPGAQTERAALLQRALQENGEAAHA